MKSARRFDHGRHVGKVGQALGRRDAERRMLPSRRCDRVSEVASEVVWPPIRSVTTVEAPL